MPRNNEILRGDSVFPPFESTPTVSIAMESSVEHVREVAEELREARCPRTGAGVPLHVHPEWEREFPWLVQGTTGRPFDLGLFGEGPSGEVVERWGALAGALGVGRVVHGRQVHEATVRVHGEGSPGLLIAPDADGHVTRASGVLLTVATADCVPVSVVDPERRVVAMLHAGWRGAAAGILERGVEVLGERFRSEPRVLRVHLGPAICGSCYEVGPEVHEALGLEPPDAPTPVDLRGVLAARVVEAGVAAGRVSASSHCTRCGGSSFYSHRGGCRERQVGFLGVRP